MLEEYIKSYVNRKVGFVGVGISNMPIIRLFSKHSINITVRDAKDITKGEFGEELASLGVKCFVGDKYLEGIDEDVLFLSPGVKQFMPEFEAAKSRDTVLTTEMQEFLKLCPCKTIGVTGSDGKTTTTTLIAKLLEAEGYTVHLGGNIGKNLFACLDDIKPDDYAVIELSSFQLMKMSVSPQIAVITNIAPNHLDWHGDMEEYINAKCNIFAFQGNNGVCVFNLSNTVTNALSSKYNGILRNFGVGKGDYSIHSDGIYNGGKLILADDDILLPGAHNRENFAAAIAATEGLVSIDSIKSLAKTFGGVEHRIELVRELNGVKYYNSSIDSSPSRTKAALESFKEKLIVITGGYDKKVPLEALGDLFKRKAKSVILMGHTGPKIKDILSDCEYEGTVLEATDMWDAVSKAKAVAELGDTVILSPAAASFDMFKNFAERGNIYKKLVNEL